MLRLRVKEPSFFSMKTGSGTISSSDTVTVRLQEASNRGTKSKSMSRFIMITVYNLK